MRQRTNGFTVFMAKLEGKPVTPRPKYLIEDYDYVSVYCMDALRSLCDGDPDELESAFCWDDTPQGHGYWRSRWIGEEYMSDEDWEFCDELYRSRT